MNAITALSIIKQRLNKWQTRPSVGRKLRRKLHDRISLGSTGVFASIAGAPIEDQTVAEIYRGFYEQWEAKFVQMYLPSDLPVIEGGTSLGIVTSLIARKLDPDVILVTVEANAALIPFASHNVTMNAPGKRVEFIHGALDPSHQGPTTQMSLGASQVSCLGSGDGVVDVPRTTLSEIIRTYGIDRYSLVCDIEGAEDLMLRYDSQSLQRCQLIVIEVHPFEIPVIEDYVRRFAEIGFRLIDRSGRNKRGQVLCMSRQ